VAGLIQEVHDENISFESKNQSPKSVILAILVLPVVVLAVGDRVGGDGESLYESLNCGGASFATNSGDTIKLGGSLGQGGMILIGTNTSADCQSGFWKAEGACELYPATITGMRMGTNDVGITFAVVNSNAYRVMYATSEEGGVPQGQHAFTNLAQVLVGQGLAGSTTTIWENVSSATNQARFYLIDCRE